jgi:hypothetical protein
MKKMWLIARREYLTRVETRLSAIHLSAAAGVYPVYFWIGTDSSCKTQDASPDSGHRCQWLFQRLSERRFNDRFDFSPGIDTSTMSKRLYRGADHPFPAG